MITALLTQKAQRLLFVSGLVMLVTLALRVPLASPTMLPVAVTVTVGIMGALAAAMWSVRSGEPPWAVPGLPETVVARDWVPEFGSVLIGVTDDSPHAERHDGHPFAVWRADPHLLLAGSTGAGKSATIRWLARSLLASGYRVAGFDGKGSGAMLPLRGRAGIVGVADTPGEWTELINVVRAEMDGYYDKLRAHRAGRGEKPEPVRIALLADELVDILDTVKKSFLGPLSAIARMGREADIRIVASVLRPDVTESLPGLVKAQMRARVALGKPTPQTGQMLFEDDWSKARRVADPNAADVKGRGVAVLGGRAYRVQLPWVAEDDTGWLPPYIEKQETRRPGEAKDRAAQLRAGGMSYRAIAAVLTEEGYPTRSGGPWTPASAQRLTQR